MFHAGRECAAGHPLCYHILAVDAIQDYERLYSLDVLGLADSPAGNQQEVYREFASSCHTTLKKDGMKLGCCGKETTPLFLETVREACVICALK